MRLAVPWSVAVTPDDALVARRHAARGVTGGSLRSPAGPDKLAFEPEFGHSPNTL